ncbi:hypothetical protein [Hydrogenophaga sp. OTU3427]|uniref:hypothetical protein n=1 Tax=Hydrogenophaga sp. OTU3427 TaxID=3043856 RepID=UPI00313F3961
MQKQKITRTGRTLGALACLGIGGVFWWVCWMEGSAGVGVFIFLIQAALALYLLYASDECLERTPWWIFW